jgi:hypothetical protein
MCMLMTAYAQQVPLELRPTLQRLQARERSLLNARSLLTNLLNDRESLLYPAPVGSDGALKSAPISLPRTNLTALTVLAGVGIISNEEAEEAKKNLLLQDNKVRQQIQLQWIPKIDGYLAETRSEFDSLMAQAGQQNSPVKSTATWGPGTSNGVPMDGNYRVDTCLVWGGWCDQIAADEWCGRHQFGKALKLERETIDLAKESSITLKSREVCSATKHPPSGCGAFKSITCGQK